MTLPTGSLSMSQIATELGLSLPLSLQHAWVRALAQVSGAACDFNSLRGKTGRFDGSLPCSGSTILSIVMNAPFFGGTIGSLSNNTNTTALTLSINVTFPHWTGNVFVKNNSTGVSATLSFNGTGWSGTGSLLRSGFTDNFTILPSS